MKTKHSKNPKYYNASSGNNSNNYAINVLYIILYMLQSDSVLLFTIIVSAMFNRHSDFLHLLTLVDGEIIF